MSAFWRRAPRRDEEEPLTMPSLESNSLDMDDFASSDDNDGEDNEEQPMHVLIADAALSHRSLQEEAQHRQHATQGPCPFIERPFRVNPSLAEGELPIPKEATAQAMDSAAKGVLHSSAAFLGPALIQLATATAREQCPDCTEAELRIYGFHPSSVLTLASVVATLSTALCLPLLGAMLDRSHHRKTSGAITGYLLIAINAAQIATSRAHWRWFLASHVAADFLFILHSMILLAYLQNLTTNTKALSRYTSKFAVVQFSSMAVFMLGMTVYARHWSSGDILLTSRVAHVISSTWSLVFIGYSWLFLFTKRGPRVLVERGTMVGDSVRGLWTSVQAIRQDYPALKWMLFTILWSPEMGSGSHLSMYSTLQKSLLQMNSGQVSLSALIVLASTVLGARLSGYLCARYHALFSFRLNLIVLAATNAAMAIMIQGPEQVRLFYCFSIGVGLSLGWLTPTERVLFCTLAPAGHEAEMMGVILCVHSAAAWVPPLLFSAVNEAGYSLQWALLSQNALLLSALVLSSGIGAYDEAVRQARDPRKAARLR